jgi:hypothetical protein
MRDKWIVREREILLRMRIADAKRVTMSIVREMGIRREMRIT